ncbi:MAG TPA: HNH endonuclease, partial [Puia sp.]|nr:HNH endonuclease [Puia sp.]
MINVKRPDCPDILKTGLTPVSEGQLETQDIILFFRDPANRDPANGPVKYRRMGQRGHRIKESFTVYSDKTVRELLKKMSHGKCVYCESRITAIYNGDIDHFRPKGRYQWLAADWENLLFACPFCNQTHTHEIALDGTIREVVQGKLDQFPLLSEACRLTILQGDNFLSDETAYKKALEQ